MRRIILVLAVALIMAAMLAASALPSMAANGPNCEKAKGLETAHESAIPEEHPVFDETPGHEHVPCNPD